MLECFAEPKLEERKLASGTAFNLRKIEFREQIFRSHILPNE